MTLPSVCRNVQKDRVAVVRRAADALGLTLDHGKQRPRDALPKLDPLLDAAGRLGVAAVIAHQRVALPLGPQVAERIHIRPQQISASLDQSDNGRRGRRGGRGDGRRRRHFRRRGRRR